MLSVKDFGTHHSHTSLHDSAFFSIYTVVATDNLLKKLVLWKKCFILIPVRFFVSCFLQFFMEVMIFYTFSVFKQFVVTNFSKERPGSIVTETQKRNFDTNSYIKKITFSC